MDSSVDIALLMLRLTLDAMLVVHGVNKVSLSMLSINGAPPE